ncbi:hypothetical protein [Saccharothrix violaceirubra]|uniref:Uncharacterized protein n=1 Tax=Saccharothrix violaceirubra TaxID=413306 RepID=A0A7W7T5G0_9PSEU|nr:hypothetical protein [Saccharothrix violaceirubra]MBB4966923.1 hypothetical protein [Saccharothrix violaceirubra]
MPSAKPVGRLPGELCMWQLGDEKGLVDGYPARRRSGEGFCGYEVGLRRPETRNDRVVLTVDLRRADKTADACPATQKLTEAALGRVPDA